MGFPRIPDQRPIARGSDYVDPPLAASESRSAAILAVRQPGRRRHQGGSEYRALKAAATLYEGIRVETLDNGLKVYLKPVATSPVVTVMVAYKVGSSDEDLTATGLSHYLEHLMFKGTEKIKPGDIDRITLRNGGANNAYTSEDYTIFHFDFDKDRWPVALDIEADRMRNLRIDARTTNSSRRRGPSLTSCSAMRTSPWDLEQKAILPLLFGKTAPYGHPVIGEREHVMGATAAIIKGHYDKWYHPNNASLIIVGGIDPEAALKEVKKRFADIPRPSAASAQPEPKELPKRPAEMTMESKFEAPRLLMGFTTVRTGTPDDVVLDIIQAILPAAAPAGCTRSWSKARRLLLMLAPTTTAAAIRDGSASRWKFCRRRIGPPSRKPCWPS